MFYHGLNNVGQFCFYLLLTPDYRASSRVYMKGKLIFLLYFFPFFWKLCQESTLKQQIRFKSIQKKEREVFNRRLYILKRMNTTKQNKYSVCTIIFRSRSHSVNGCGDYLRACIFHQFRNFGFMIYLSKEFFNIQETE